MFTNFKIVIVSLLVFLFCKNKINVKQSENDYDMIDLLVKTTPLMQPYLCLSYSREYCDSVKTKRKNRLNEYEKIVRSIKNKNESLDYFMLKLAELKADVNLDYTIALRQVVKNNNK